MLIKVEGAYSDEFLRLGYDGTENSLHDKAKARAPKNARSYQIMQKLANNGIFDVRYFTVADEGPHRIPKRSP